jgi:hypothetical protein
MNADQVLVIPPMRSPNTGRMLGWSVSHAPDCNWANSITPLVPYSTMNAVSVPSHVGRCGRCGGGR